MSEVRVKLVDMMLRCRYQNAEFIITKNGRPMARLTAIPDQPADVVEDEFGRL